jgi:hypothetical protein
MADLAGESTQEKFYPFTFRSKLEHGLFGQVLAYACNKLSYGFIGKLMNCQVAMTPAQFAEVSVIYEVLRRQLKKEMDTFLPLSFTSTICFLQQLGKIGN